MAAAQSVVTAGVMALEGGIPLQAVDYRQLRSRLLAGGQVLGVLSP